MRGVILTEEKGNDTRATKLKRKGLLTPVPDKVNLNLFCD